MNIQGIGEKTYLRLKRIFMFIKGKGFYLVLPLLVVVLAENVTSYFICISYFLFYFSVFKTF